MSYDPLGGFLPPVATKLTQSPWFLNPGKLCQPPFLQSLLYVGRVGCDTSVAEMFTRANAALVRFINVVPTAGCVDSGASEKVSVADGIPIAHAVPGAFGPAQSPMMSPPCAGMVAENVLSWPVTND